MHQKFLMEKLLSEKFYKRKSDKFAIWWTWLNALQTATGFESVLLKVEWCKWHVNSSADRFNKGRRCETISLIDLIDYNNKINYNLTWVESSGSDCCAIRFLSLFSHRTLKCDRKSKNIPLNMNSITWRLSLSEFLEHV